MLINGVCLQNAIISGANNILNNKELVDDLNIFPVPDGDTGTNMSMTMMAAADELKKLTSDDVSKVASVCASHLLRGARGNSGVILSLLFRGFSEGLKDLKTANGSNLVNALDIGVKAAYNAVMKPTEGTILTVARVAFERGRNALLTNEDPVYVWSEICKGANDALETTPELLPVLKKAGVVDAGGKGLCLIFLGMMSVFENGKIIEATEKAQEKKVDSFKKAAAEFDEEINFGYCTELVIGRSSSAKKEPKDLRAYLETIGDCVVVVDDSEIVKVHVHTDEPGKVLQEGLTLGQLLNVKVDNLREQHREVKEAAKKNVSGKKKKPLKPVKPTNEFGFVAVSVGEGLETVFTDLGCNHIISGGQTMNPSTEDILEAIMATPAKTVFVLPNNKNIILAAEQAIEFAKDRQVIVLNTRTIPQGLSAMLCFDPDLSAEENKEIMTDAASNINTGSVTFAARDSEFGGFKIKKDDIIALNNGKLVFKEKDPAKAVYKLTRSMVNRNTSFVTLIYGEDISEEEAEKAYNHLKSKLGSHIDITLVNGGQPVYYFIVSIE